MIVPNRNYRVEVEYDRVGNRWKARFFSEKPEGISFAFPLPDRATFDPYRDSATIEQVGAPRILSAHEEILLALTFQQMVTTALEQMSASRQLSAPSATEEALVN